MSLSNEQLFAFIKKNPISIGCAVLSLGIGAAIYFRTDKLPAAHALLDQACELARPDHVPAQIVDPAALAASQQFTQRVHLQDSPEMACCLTRVSARAHWQ